MPHRIEWYLEGQIIQAIVWGQITFEEVREANTELIEILSSVNEQRVHLLCECDGLIALPVSLPILHREINCVRHPNLGWTVIVSSKTHPILRHVMATFSKLTGLRLFRAKSQHEALEQLCSLNPILSSQLTMADSANPRF